MFCAFVALIQDYCMHQACFASVLGERKESKGRKTGLHYHCSANCGDFVPFWWQFVNVSLYPRQAKCF